MEYMEYFRLTAQLAVLRRVAADGYATMTLSNVIQQMESRRRHYEEKGGSV